MLYVNKPEVGSKSTLLVVVFERENVSWILKDVVTERIVCQSNSTLPTVTAPVLVTQCLRHLV